MADRNLWEADEIQKWPLAKLRGYAQNPKTHPPDQVDRIKASIVEFGWVQPIIVDESGEIIAGHGRAMAAADLGIVRVPVIVARGWTDERKRAYRIADNALAEAPWNIDLLKVELADLGKMNFPLALVGFPEIRLAEFVSGFGGGVAAVQNHNATLAESFGVPPFSVLNARAGWWQLRKAAWIGLGMQPELGRPEARAYAQDLMRGEHVVGQAGNGHAKAGDGVSIYDPTLAELSLRWFCPPGGRVWNPFMGESSIGIVASRLGYQYTAVDVRPEQVAANQAQSDIICAGDYPAPRWLAGDAATADPAALCGGQVDFVFTCPPYADLERYSDDPRDLSTMTYPKFMEAYRRIIARACAALRQDRFAVVTIGEVRGADGAYYGLVPDTIAAFVDAGLAYYNEAILVTAVGSLPQRTRRQFEASRKLGRTHQSHLVFCKGDPRKAAAAVGQVEFGDPPSDDGPDAPQRDQVAQAGSQVAQLERWTVSAAWLTKVHDCTIAGIASRCGGGCCRHPAFWPPKSGAGVCPMLGTFGCTFSADDKPVTCALYPLTLNAKGMVVLHQRAMFASGACKGAYGQGPMLIDALAPSLTSLFGADQVARVRADVVDGRDSFFDVPPAVAAAYAREKDQAAANIPPTPRSAQRAP